MARRMVGRFGCEFWASKCEGVFLCRHAPRGLEKISEMRKITLEEKLSFHNGDFLHVSDLSEKSKNGYQDGSQNLLSKPLRLRVPDLGI